MSESSTFNAKRNEQKDKQIRRIYQNLLQRRPLNYWNILDFPYLAEVVRHDSSYLRRILTHCFVDQPALSQYLVVIAWREVSKGLNKSKGACSRHPPFKREILPIGLERTLWTMYKRQVEISNIWSPSPTLEMSRNASNELPLLDFTQFVSKINGVTESQPCSAEDVEKVKNS